MRAPIEVVPRGVIRLVAFADFQGDRVEVLVLGIGIGEECWVIDYHVLPGDTSQPTVYVRGEQLDAHGYRRIVVSRGHDRSVIVEYEDERTEPASDEFN